MSGAIMGKIDEMGNRIDDLEKSITAIVDQAGIDFNDMTMNEATTNMGRLSNDNATMSLSMADITLNIDGVSRK